MGEAVGLGFALRACWCWKVPSVEGPQFLPPPWHRRSSLLVSVGVLRGSGRCKPPRWGARFSFWCSGAPTLGAPPVTLPLGSPRCQGCAKARRPRPGPTPPPSGSRANLPADRLAAGPGGDGGVSVSALGRWPRAGPTPVSAALILL